MQALKSNLRHRVRTVLRHIPPTQRAAAGVAIATTLRQLPVWQKARTVLAFQPLPSEPDLTALWPNGFDPDKVWAFPKIHGHQLHLYRVEGAEDFSPGPLGLAEPRPDPSRLLLPSDIDLALVPGLAFDRHGGRLGRGRGFYDRLLSHPSWRGTTLGVAFRQTEQPAIPRARHDIALHGVLWSDGTITGLGF